MDFGTFLITVIIASLSGLGATLYMEKQKNSLQKRRVSNCLILLYLEISNQTYWIKNLQAGIVGLVSCSKHLLETPDTEWNNTRYFLAEVLPPKDFTCLVEHYRRIADIRRGLNLNPYYIHSKDQLVEIVQNAHSAFKVLLKDPNVKIFVDETLKKESTRQRL